MRFLKFRYCEKATKIWKNGDANYGRRATQRANITKKVHKPPRNHYIEWPVFSVIGLNCESHGEKGRTCTKYKILRGSQVFFFHFIHRAWVSTGAWHPPKFWTSPLAPADFEVLNTNWHPQSSFYVISGTLSFKFLTQALTIEFTVHIYFCRYNSLIIQIFNACSIMELSWFTQYICYRKTDIALSLMFS